MHTKNQKKHTSPKAAAIRLTLLLFPMCTKPRARYQNSEPPNQRNRSRLASRSNCTHLKEISPPQYHYSTLGRCKIGKFTFPSQFANIYS